MRTLATITVKWLIQNRLFILTMPSKILRAFLSSRLGTAISVLFTALFCIKIQVNISKSTSLTSPSSIGKGVLADVKTRIQLLFGLLELRSHWTLNLGSTQLSSSQPSRAKESQLQVASEATDDSAVRLFCSPEFERQVLAFLADQVHFGSTSSSTTPQGFSSRRPTQDEQTLPSAPPMKPPWLSFPIEVRRGTGGSDGGVQLKQAGLIMTEQCDEVHDQGQG